MNTLKQMSWALCVISILLGAGCGSPTLPYEALSANQEQMQRSFSENNMALFFSCWTTDAVALIQDQPIDEGLESILEEGIIHPDTYDQERLNRRFWMSGDYIYEIGTSLTGSKNSTEGYAIVWNRQLDNTWKRTVEIKCTNSAPSEEQLADWKKQTPADMPFVYMKGGSSKNMEVVLREIEMAEQEFHANILALNLKKAHNAFSEKTNFNFSGSKRWWDYSGERKEMFSNIDEFLEMERETVTVGGNDQLAYVVNRFPQWRYTISSDQEQIVVNWKGKGLHIWQRQPDGEWKILIDIANEEFPPEISSISRAISESAQQKDQSVSKR